MRRATHDTEAHNQYKGTPTSRGVMRQPGGKPRRLQPMTRDEEIAVMRVLAGARKCEVDECNHYARNDEGYSRMCVCHVAELHRELYNPPFVAEDRSTTNCDGSAYKHDKNGQSASPAR